MEALLKVTNLHGGYSKKPIIKDISFEVQSKDFLGIIGPNGSGKTTLLRLLSRVLIPQQGSINMFCQDIFKLRPKEFCRKTSFVQQETLINFPFSVYEIVLLGRVPHLQRMQTETKHDIEQAISAMKLTDTLYLKDKFIDELSAGEAQRVMLAKALAQEPILLFLDEPTSHLDIGHQRQIMDLLKRLNQHNNLTIIMVLHDLNLASQYCSRILLLEEGKICRQGTPEEVLTYSNIEKVYKTVVLVNNNPVNGKPYIILVPEEDNVH